jgi:hypothetical protein
MRSFVLAAALVLTATCAAQAACDDRDVQVVDITKVANRKIDVSKVTASARSLAGEGVTVRVRVYDTLRGAKDIDELADRVMRECEWVRQGARLSNLLFIAFAVEKGDIKVATGSAINARISEAFATKAIVTYMQPRWQSYKQDSSALTAGLVGMLDSFKSEMARPLRGPQNMTVINTAPTDFSGLWKVLGAIIGLGAAAFFVVLFLRSREDSGNATSAQAEASRVRAGCISRLISLTEPTEHLVLQAKVDGARDTLSAAEARKLDTALTEIQNFGKRGLEAFSRFDSPEKDDPNRKGLTVSAYRSNQSRYEEILIQFVEPAEALIAQIGKAADRPGKKKAAA